MIGVILKNYRLDKKLRDPKKHFLTSESAGFGHEMPILYELVNGPE